MDRKSFYSQASIQLRDWYAKQQRNKYVNQNDNVSEYGRQLLKLIKIIPNWETYLTARQVQAVKSYVINLHASEVAKELAVEDSTAYEILFGRKNGRSLGALGKLKIAYKRLQETGYFKNLEKMNKTV